MKYVNALDLLWHYKCPLISVTENSVHHKSLIGLLNPKKKNEISKPRPHLDLRGEDAVSCFVIRSDKMAEAHAAVAFSFTITHEGVNFDVNHDALHAVWESGVRSWKKRIARFKNRLINIMYPAAPISWVFTVSIVLAFVLAKVDVSLGLIDSIQSGMPGVRALSYPYKFYASAVVFGTLVWLLKIFVLRYLLKLLLMYHGWMFEPRGKVSIWTKLWSVLVRLLGGRKPLLYSYQASLPKMFVPRVEDTMERYIKSVRPLMDDANYERMKTLSEEFKNGVGKKLQRYLLLKSWWATNYVSDWWEEYVYLRGRSPIMVNSNYYGVGAVFHHPTKIQAARAANVTYAFLKFRREIEREELSPILLNGTVPLCSQQYERQFNSVRLPGVETDKLVHWYDSRHIVVYHKGCYYKMYIHYKGRLLNPAELELSFKKIIEDNHEPAKGEEKLGALTAGDRIPWAKARKEYFGKGVNKTSLDSIEKSAFVVVLDDEPRYIDLNEPNKLSSWARAMLHGKGYDRWFDKTFNLIISANGRIGFNAEHSWADAPIMAHLWEYGISEDIAHLGADAPIMAHLWETTMAIDTETGYTETGHCKGEASIQPPNPIRLQWEIPDECCAVIDNSLRVSQALANDVDLHLEVHTQFGKGLIKKCKTSPDAFIQMALQLAYFRDAGKFCLTYEASMTRLFREGRTETVRSCTIDAANFARAMDDKTKTKAEKMALFKKASETHQESYRLAMTGNGIDRHLFCLYVVSKYLEIESPFLKEVLGEPWRLSTSQTPHTQTDRLDLLKHPDHICAGGGFGPVADDGYGVSYIIAGEYTIFFHVSCKRSCAETNAKRFGRTIVKALDDLKNLFEV
ncbi:carnitine O-palmitoyltransferase 1, liver isoform [Lingula anatina]|uniref:carnitine O-palmitoyltransferase n=1 Tax=Lingula anatina TaxID=7574 RepID=A0A1S3IT97_LINAN|nr:carnitine O-palmitoyltransferase 1, liver isoform [Lingula anatina]|eukprot:XP_013401422.1 carnitine O-palmitoyltransferase 1, liver isoform [Lingula anatina]